MVRENHTRLTEEQRQLAADNWPLARYLARKYGRGLPRDEAEGVAALVLVRAARTFEASYGVRFSTYVGLAVRRQLQKERGRRGPRLASLDTRLGARKRLSPALLVLDDARPALDVLADVEAAGRALASLTDSERTLLLRSLDGERQTALAKEYGVSRQIISNRLQTAATLARLTLESSGCDSA